MTDSAPLLEDYKLKAGFANNVVGRVLTEFQLMVTLETAVATGLIFTTAGTLRPAAKWMALLLVGISSAWAATGYVASGRSKVAQTDSDSAGNAWALAAGLPMSGADRYKPVGKGQNHPMSAWVVPAALGLMWSAVTFLFFFTKTF